MLGKHATTQLPPQQNLHFKRDFTWERNENLKSNGGTSGGGNSRG